MIIFQGQKLLNIDITEDMVKKKLDSLNPNKSPGVDKHAQILRTVLDSVDTRDSFILYRKPSHILIYILSTKEAHVRGPREYTGECRLLIN